MHFKFLSPLGEVHDNIIKIEFFEKGSPHDHFSLWMKGATHINVDRECGVCAFIDEHILGMIPM